MVMPCYKLYYHNSKGRAEAIRIIFAHAGVKYEDIRHERDEWPAIKPGMEFERVPVLDVDGTRISGSINIIRYLGITFGMAGNNELDNAVLGGSADLIADIDAAMAKAFHADDDKKAAALAEFKEKVVPNLLEVLQKNVKNGHFIGSEKLSWVDILGYWYLEVLEKLFGISVANYPVLQKLHADVAAQPNIKKWLETGPKTGIN